MATAACTLFISDLHLDAARPETTALLCEFLAHEARSAEALYILGDLFEYWIGDDDTASGYEPVTAALRALSDSGVALYFQHGNRDFLVGTQHAARCGMHLLPESLVIDLYGTPTLLLHGDTLCTDDVEYHAFRRTVRDPAWQCAFVQKPLTERRAMAEHARAASRARTAQLAEYIMDVNGEAVHAACTQAGVREMIHGHTHRPAVHIFTHDGLPARRIVLGDWHTDGSVLRVTPDQRMLAVLSQSSPRASQAQRR